MGNTFFHFKQFTVQQEHAFKISTEACVFGALCTKFFNSKKVLDIGTGTGLLSMMYAQEHRNATIKAVELDLIAANEAKQNINNSDFKDAIEVVCADIKSENLFSEKSFELIISNPPFFGNHLLGENKYVNQAKHQVALSLQDFVNACEKYIAEDGCVAVLLPLKEQEELSKLFEEIEFRVFKSFYLFHSEIHNPLRLINFYSKNFQEYTSENIYIKDLNNNYSVSMKNLLKNYYNIF